MSKDTIAKFGGPTVHLDLFPVKGKDPTCRSKEVVYWYSTNEAPGNCQSLTADWFGLKVKECLMSSPYEAAQRLTGHAFRKGLLPFVGRCREDLIHGILAGDWAEGSVAQRRYLEQGGDSLRKYENDPCSDPLYKVVCWNRARREKAFDDIPANNLVFQNKPKKVSK